MPAISIIVPVYNAERFINKCVDSLIHQTFTDIEFYFVNDCSKDRSLELLNDYARRDPRVKIIDLPQNCGAAGARNHAISAVSGNYIAFVDIDDWVDHDRYEKLYAYTKQSDVDAVLDGFVCSDNEGHIKAEKPITQSLRYLTGAQMLNEMFFGSISAFAPWHGIYRASIVKALKFQPIRGDDAIFNFDFYARANKICLTPPMPYHFRELDASETRGYHPPESVGSLRGVEAAATYLKNNKELRSLVPNFDLIVDAHLLGEYATIARNTCEKDCPETFSKRREFLGAIAASKYFRVAYENAAARARLGGRKRRFLSLLYSGRLDLITTYMYIKGLWKKAQRRVSGR